MSHKRSFIQLVEMDHRFLLFACQQVELELTLLNARINETRVLREAELTNLKERFAQWRQMRMQPAITVDDLRHLINLPIIEIDRLIELRDRLRKLIQDLTEKEKELEQVCELRRAALDQWTGMKKHRLFLKEAKVIKNDL